jgi:hypothetical protein
MISKALKGRNLTADRDKWHWKKTAVDCKILMALKKRG